MDLSGGDKMIAYLRKIAEGIDADEGLRVRVGFLEGSTCGQDNSAPAPQVAFWNEFGTPGADHPVPPRPFFRTTVRTKSPTWGKLVAAALKNTEFDGRRALTVVGLRVKAQVQQQIVDTVEPRNAPATVEAKGFDKPLEDSKNMKRAVSFEVVGKAQESGE